MVVFLSDSVAPFFKLTCLFLNVLAAQQLFQRQTYTAEDGKAKTLIGMAWEPGSTLRGAAVRSKFKKALLHLFQRCAISMLHMELRHRFGTNHSKHKSY